MFDRHAERGFTLIELIIAIVILGVGIAGVMLAFSTAVRSSADPLVTKQMLAVAEEISEEILLKPYSTTITGGFPSSCGSADADRRGFNKVGDYNNYQTTGICDIEGQPVTGLSDYNLQVTVTRGAWQGIADTLIITVTVSRGSTSLTLNSWRTPYAT